MAKKQYIISDIEKSLSFFKKQGIDAVSAAVDDMNRLVLKGYHPGNRTSIDVTVFTSDVTKKPEVTKTDTLE